MSTRREGEILSEEAVSVVIITVSTTQQIRNSVVMENENENENMYDYEQTGIVK